VGDGSGDARSVLVRAAVAAVASALCLFAAGCGGEDIGAAKAPDPPVGSPVLPDLMPKPQFNVLTQKVGDRWRLRFSTTIVNVGDGDFILRAVRNVRGGWKAEQDIPYSEQGARRVRIPAQLVWGGDGHNHWHINRVAVVTLVPLAENGRVEQGGKVYVDGKVGFCFYDFAQELPSAVAERTYTARGCGKEDWTVVGMGLSPGWNDTYRFALKGQWVDVTDVPAGKYRLFTDIDPKGWFHEASTKNNRTWIDIDLRRTPQGLAAPKIGTGPSPS
jgi:hypothetical protein